jgi:hypothetical protein
MPVRDRRRWARFYAAEGWSRGTRRDAFVERLLTRWNLRSLGLVDTTAVTEPFLRSRRARHPALKVRPTEVKFRIGDAGSEHHTDTATASSF